MGFKIGNVVNYNNQNYIIIDVLTRETSNGKIAFLKIKNILNQEILTVDSKNVSEINLNRKTIKEENITDTGYIESLFDSVGTNEEKNESLFDLSGENTFTLDNVFLEEEKVKEENEEHYSTLIQNFQTPKIQTHLTPRRMNYSNSFENNSVVNETFSNLNVIGQLETTEIIPRRIREEYQNRENNINNNNNNNNQNYAEVNQISSNIERTELTRAKNSLENQEFNDRSQIQFDLNKNEFLDKEPIFSKKVDFNKNEFIKQPINNNVENIRSNQMSNRIYEEELNSKKLNQTHLEEQIIFEKHPIFSEKLDFKKDNNTIDGQVNNNPNNIDVSQISEMKNSFEKENKEDDFDEQFLIKKHKIVENSITNLVDQINNANSQNEGTSQKIAINLEQKETLTETLDTDLVEKEVEKESLKLNKKYLDNKQLDTLETGPLNTKKFLESFSKQQNIQNILNNDFEKNNTTNTLFGVSSGFDKNTLKNSKIYKKFKIMSSWLIILFTITLLIPIICYFSKAVLIWLNPEFEFNLLNIFSMFKIQELFIVDILLISLSLIFLSIFLIYLITYIILVGDKQYKKIAYYNYQLENKIEVIDSIQNYNNESSLYLVKVHNEIKKMRKEIKEIKKDNLSSEFLSSKKEISKISH